LLWALQANRLTLQSELPRLAAIRPIYEDALPVGNTVFAFGPFRLYPAERLLLKEEKPVRLGSRALEILIALVERAGQTVLKDQLATASGPTRS
jgi:DNA-binding response OmpR family regulator